MQTKTNLKLKYGVKIENLENSRARITVTIPSADFETLFEKAKEKVLGEVKMNGFRDGKVPYEAFLKSHGEFSIRQEMGYMAVDKNYIDVILNEKIESIGRPEIAILKVTKGEDFEYQITTDLLPKVILGDYKTYVNEFQIAKIVSATDDEVNEALEELRRMRITPTSTQATAGEEKIDELPEINEAFLKSVGDFKTVDDLKKRIGDNIDNEKKWKEEEKRRARIFDKLIADTKTEIPNSLILNELTKIEEKIKTDLAQMGVSFDDYLKHMKKNLPDWQESEKENAKKQVILQLALLEIAKKENIKVSEATVQSEVAHLLSQYKEIDPERARAYTEEKMTNSLVAEFLVNGKVPEEKDLFGSHEGHNH